MDFIMNSKQFTESTTSGAIATVATPVGKTQTRGKGIYPNEKGGNLLTGKKTNEKFANSKSVKESQEQDVSEASNRLTIPDSPYTRKNFGSEKLVEILKSRGWQGPFQIQQLGKKWIKSLVGLQGIDTDDYAMVQGKDPEYDGWVVYAGNYVFGIEYGYHMGDANKVAKWTKDWNQDLSEAKLDEEDIIIVPGQGNRIKPGFIPKAKDRTDHEVEMAKSDLFQSNKNAKKIYELIKDIPEEVGIEGWVQEKIIKANDYLNTVREYLEHKQLSEDTIEGKRDNFSIDDIKQLEKIKDLETIKARARELIKGFPDRRMKPEKIDYFYNRIDSLFSPMQVIKLMYDLLLAGEGMKTIGPRYSTSANSYQRRFDEMTGGVIAGGGVGEGLADDFASMAKSMGMNAKIRQPGEKQPVKPAFKATPPSPEERIKLQQQLEQTKREINKLRQDKDESFSSRERWSGLLAQHDYISKRLKIESVDQDMAEGYRILPNIDREKYQERQGLEGPFRARNGKVYYYDPKAGLAYDPDTDFYIDYDTLTMMDREMSEGVIGKVLAGTALLASLWGIGQQQAQQVYSNSPQLQTLIKYHQMAAQQNDQAKIKELERRIENHKTRLSLGKGEVMGADDKPIVPSFESSIMRGIQNEQNDDWGSMSKRDFKRREMEHELGHETRKTYNKPKGMFFYNVPAGKETDASRAGLKQSKSGKWYGYQDNMLGKGRYWEPKNESVTENTDQEHDSASLQKHFGAEVAYDAASHGPKMMQRKDLKGNSYQLIRLPNKNYKATLVTENTDKCPECGGKLVAESELNEEGNKDACYHKVKSRYKVWPSAYASGALVKCRKVGASNWGNKSK
jgi:hypothetical protein